MFLFACILLFNFLFTYKYIHLSLSLPGIGDCQGPPGFKPTRSFAGRDKESALAHDTFLSPSLPPSSDQYPVLSPARQLQALYSYTRNP